MKGGGSDFENELPDSDLQYLEVPLLLEYKLPVGKYHLRILASPYASVLISAKDQEDVEAESLYNSTELGYNLGVEFQLNDLGIGVTFSNGISNTFVEEVPDSFFEIDDIKGKNRFASF